MQSQRLYRSRRNRWLVGVCGGLGLRYGFPPLVLRLALIVLTIFWLPTGLIYLLAWLLMPEEPQEFEPEPWQSAEQEGNEQAPPPAFEQSSPDDPPSGTQPQPEEERPTDPWAR